MRVSVFVDGANFFFMQNNGLGWFADPKKLLDYIEVRFGDIADAFYYIGKDAPPKGSLMLYREWVFRLSASQSKQYTIRKQVL